MALPSGLRLPSVDALRLPTRIPLRLRVFFRGAFLLLALATVALALSVLQEEKQRSYANYQDVFGKTQAQIASRLRHPTGQLTPETELRRVLCAFGFDGAAGPAEARRGAELLARVACGVRNIRATNSLIDFCLNLEGNLGGGT